MATHSSTLVWKIPWTEEPGVTLSTGVTESDTVEHSTATWSQLLHFYGTWHTLFYLLYVPPHTPLLGSSRQSTQGLLTRRVSQQGWYFKKKAIVGNFPGGPLVKALPTQGAWVQSLVRELRPHMPRRVAKYFFFKVLLLCWSHRTNTFDTCKHNSTCAGMFYREKEKSSN